MAQFYGTLCGSAKTATSRCGTKASGVTAHVRGWDIGINANVHSINSTIPGAGDVVEAALTGGSNNKAHGAFDFTAWEESNGNTEFVIRLAGGYISGTFAADGKLIRINQPERKL